ncbi:MAG: recombinase RecA, partial [Elusimicrobiota bacterium]
IGAIKSGSDSIGNRARVKIVKNKVAPPFKKSEFDIIYGKGISSEGCLLDIGLEQKLIEKNGTWYSYKDTQLGQGRANSVEFLQNNEKLRAELDKKIREKVFTPKKDEKEKETKKK